MTLCPGFGPQDLPQLSLILKNQQRFVVEVFDAALQMRYQQHEKLVSHALDLKMTWLRLTWVKRLRICHHYYLMRTSFQVSVVVVVATVVVEASLRPTPTSVSSVSISSVGGCVLGMDNICFGGKRTGF